MFPHRLFCCILSCINFVLLLAVQVGAGWAKYDYTKHPFYFGLWSICSEDKCSYFNVKEVKLDFTRIFMLAALFTCFMAILFTIDWHFIKKCSLNFLPQAPTAATLNIITEVLVMVALVVFDISIKDSTPAEKLRPTKKWAFYVSCVACILSLLTGIYDIILYKFSLWGTDSSVSPENNSENNS